MSSPSIRALTTGTSARASTTARAKKDMKPRSTPCLLLNRSRWRRRRSMSAEQSTSLNVVRIAAVRCASTSRSAMRRRRRLIGTRSTRSAGGRPGARAVALPRVRRSPRRRGPCGGVGAALADVAEHVLLGEAAILAGPAMAAGSRLCSVTSRRTAGLKVRAASSPVGGAAGLRLRAASPRVGGVAGRSRGRRAPRVVADGRRGRRRHPAVGRRTRARRGDRAAGAWRATARPAGLGDPRHDGPDPHRGAFPLHDLQHAGRGRGDLHRRLVGLELEQRLVRVHGVAVVLEPARDGALAHRLAERRDADLEAHRLARAGRGRRRRGLDDRRFSSVWWILCEPVAGLAASSRPT